MKSLSKLFKGHIENIQFNKSKCKIMTQIQTLQKSKESLDFTSKPILHKIREKMDNFPDRYSTFY